MSPGRKGLKITLLAMVGCAGVALAVVQVLEFQVCRDWAFICENTGSRKGHREWFLGWESADWYKESELERFMKADYPSQLQYRWTSYAGTGKNIFGMRILSGHGRPGPILLLHQEMLNAYVRRLDAAGRKALYELLASGDESRVEREVERIYLAYQRIESGAKGEVDASGDWWEELIGRSRDTREFLLEAVMGGGGVRKRDELRAWEVVG